MVSTGAQSNVPVPLDLPDHRQNPESNYLQRERQELLWREMDCLPPDTRVCFEVCDMEQLSTVDAATCLGITVASLKSRRSRGRVTLRRRLEPRLSGCCAAQKA